MISDLLIAFAISFLIAMLAYLRGSLGPTGVLGALIVGTLTFGLGGWIWGVLLGIFFVSSSALSHYKETEKRQTAEKFDKGNRRDFGQTMANGGLGSVIALFSVIYPSPIWFPLFIGIMATVTADTWATELGTLAKRPPRLITNGNVVEVGTSGGITPLGIIVSLCGGTLIGLVAGLLLPEIGIILSLVVGGVGGLMGSLFDSLLGATVQQIYYCDVCQKETERKIHKCGHETRPLRGWKWLNNDLVNLIASLVGGVTALGFWKVLTELPFS